MRKLILFGSILVFFMLMIPNISAVEYNTIQEKEHIKNKMESIYKTLDIPPWFSNLTFIILTLLFDYTIVKWYFSRTIYVDNDAQENWYDFMHVRTIQEGIEHARFVYANNIRVYDGIYKEAITMKSSIFFRGNMGFRLIGNGSDTTHIDAYGSDYGINLNFTSGWSRIRGFTISNASNSGIYIGDSQWNFISENTFINNSCGIENSGGHYSPIWKNNFINNFQHAYDTGKNNWSFDWYGDIPINGNYWDDYIGIDANGDGIGDTPYNIPGGTSMDSYPLMESWEE